MGEKLSPLEVISRARDMKTKKETGKTGELEGLENRRSEVRAQLESAIQEYEKGKNSASGLENDKAVVRALRDLKSKVDEAQNEFEKIEAQITALRRELSPENESEGDVLVEQQHQSWMQRKLSSLRSLAGSAKAAYGGAMASLVGATAAFAAAHQGMLENMASADSDTNTYAVFGAVTLGIIGAAVGLKVGGDRAKNEFLKTATK